MGVTLIVITKLFLALFYIIVMRKFMKVFFISSSENIYTYILWGIYYFFQIFLETGSKWPAALNLAINMLFVFTITRTAYSKNYKNCFMFSILICAIWMMTEIITYLILNVLNLNDQSGIAGAAVSKNIMLIMSILIKRYLRKNSNMNISNKHLLGLLIVPAGSIYIMHNIFLLSTQTSKKLIFPFTAVILLLSLNYIIFEIYEWLSEFDETQKKNMLYEQQLELFSQQATEREIQNAEMQKLRHNIKGHLISLLGMIQVNKNPEAIKYIYFLLNDNNLHNIQKISNSGNIVVDTLVNYKYNLAHKDDIEFNVNIFIPSVLPFHSGNLTIILENLLENAMEACLQMKNGRRHIELEMTFQKGMLSIITCNTFEGERKQDHQGNFQTIKKNAKNHGLGIHSIKQALIPYHGEMIIEIKNGIFKVIVLMFDK